MTIITITSASSSVDRTLDVSDLKIFVRRYMESYSVVFSLLIFIVGICSFTTGAVHRTHTCLIVTHILGFNLDTVLEHMGLMLCIISTVYNPYVSSRDDSSPLWNRSPIHFVGFYFYIITLVIMALIILVSDDFTCMTDKPVIVVWSLVSIFTLCLFYPIHNIMEVYCAGVMCKDKLM